MPGRMDGKIAVITGGSGGIGSETAKLFCEEGASVVLVDLDPALLDQATEDIQAQVPGADVRAVTGDISTEAGADAAIEQAGAAFGRFNVLVNNAGVREFVEMADATEERWQRIISVNLMGTARCSRAALPILRAEPAANIVNVSSVYATVGRAGAGLYDATKAAISSMTRTLAWEEAANDIRVNAVCPGGTLTPFHLARFKADGRAEKEVRAEVKSNALISRWADVREIAWPILWLASDEASFITGSSLMVDGGTSAM